MTIKNNPDENVVTFDDFELMAQFEDDYMTISELRDYLNSFKDDYESKSTMERQAFAFENFKTVLVHVERELGKLANPDSLTPPKIESEQLIPVGTSDNAFAAHVLNELAPSLEQVKERNISYKLALREVFDSPVFGKKMAERGIRMSSFTKHSKENIISIVNRNPSGGRN